MTLNGAGPGWSPAVRQSEHNLASGSRPALEALILFSYLCINGNAPGDISLLTRQAAILPGGLAGDLDRDSLQGPAFGHAISFWGSRTGVRVQFRTHGSRSVSYRTPQVKRTVVWKHWASVITVYTYLTQIIAGSRLCAFHACVYGDRRIILLSITAV